MRIVAHDPAWAKLFAQERRLLDAAISDWITGGIHHVGSTAVEGLDAKPVIDILVGVQSLEASWPSRVPLLDLGYLYAPYRASEMHWFCKPSPARRTHHLHLIPTGSPRYEQELAFCDALRADPGLALEYAQLKHDLAQRHRDDREAYTEAKGQFIVRALASRT